MKIGFIGFGRMGSALARGGLSARILKSSEISVFDLSPKAQESAKELKISRALNLQELLEESEIVFLCVKPQSMKEVLEGIESIHLKNARGRKCFVSIAAGIPLKVFEKKLKKLGSVIRVMPNTPALLRAGMSVMSLGKKVSSIHKNWVFKLLESIGAVTIEKENKMDAVTAVSGSGPAYVFYLAEAMMEAAISMGFSKEAARQLSHQTVYGAGLMLKHRDESAEELRRQVTSPNGTTEAALKMFDRQFLKKKIINGIKKARERSVELSRVQE